MSKIKKILISFLSSAVLYIAVAFYLFQINIKDCVGCGIAPDGVTNLGPYFSDLIFSSFLIFFIIFFVSIYIFIGFLGKRKK